ncbi:MAG: BON domain-containing protein [Phenylobacterium sp.]|uniref:BON domain-containing protein n=1 Tax=Phenylobacterium sp. TaxID=1871053 RepID=UPI003918EAC0
MSGLHAAVESWEAWVMDDRTLRDKVQQALDSAAALDARAIGVAVKGGVVTLTGHVPTFGQRLAAERAARAVDGVRALAQELEVRTPDLTAQADDEVAARLVRALDADIAAPGHMIKVRVDEGHVILTGEVEHGYQRDAVERCVRGEKGVRRLTNHIVVRPRATAPDLTARIEEAFVRQARTDAAPVQVVVEDGQVRLEGRVRAAFQREIAELAVRAAPGVAGVDNRIHVEP